MLEMVDLYKQMTYLVCLRRIHIYNASANTYIACWLTKTSSIIIKRWQLDRFGDDEVKLSY